MENRKILAGALLALIPLYLLFVAAAPDNFSLVCDQTENVSPGVTDKVGFCSSIGFALQRSYYFGLLNLPVYKAGINLHPINKFFIPVLLLSALIALKKDFFQKLIFK